MWDRFQKYPPLAPVTDGPFITGANRPQTQYYTAPDGHRTLMYGLIHPRNALYRPGLFDRERPILNRVVGLS
jgi:hypothetical protein